MVNEYKSSIGSRITSIILGPLLALLGVAIMVGSQSLAESPGIVPYIGGGAFLLFGLLIFYAGLRPSKVVITDEAYEVRTGSRVNQRIPYSEMRDVTMVAFTVAARRSRPRDENIAVRAVRSRTKTFPKIELRGDGNKQIFIEVPYSGTYVRQITGNEMNTGFKMTAPYDSRAIVQDLLSRLPSSVTVDPLVAQYASTGELPDALDLPKGQINNPLANFGQ